MGELLHTLCGLLTGHRWFRTYDIHWQGKRYCRCRICRRHFWVEETDT
jgi:hypothetical protein